MGCCETKNQIRNENIKLNSKIENNQIKNDFVNINNLENKKSNSFSNSNIALNINQQGDINRYKDIKNLEE